MSSLSNLFDLIIVLYFLRNQNATTKSKKIDKYFLKAKWSSICYYLSKIEEMIIRKGETINGE